MHGMQEVSGSIPLFSTKKALYFVGSMVLFFFVPTKRSGGAPPAMQAGQWHPRSQTKPLSDLTLAVFSAPRRQLHAKARRRISTLTVFYGRGWIARAAHLKKPRRGFFPAGLFGGSMLFESTLAVLCRSSNKTETPASSQRWSSWWARVDSNHRS